MHMAWVRQVGGRLESRYRYSGSMVYNNSPGRTSAPSNASGWKKKRGPFSPRASRICRARPGHARRPLRSARHAARIAPRPHRTGSRRGEMLSRRTVPLPTASAWNSFLPFTKSSPRRSCPSCPRRAVGGRRPPLQPGSRANKRRQPCIRKKYRRERVGSW